MNRLTKILFASSLAALALAAPVAAQELERLDPDQAYSTQDTATQGSIDGDLIAPESQPAPARAETPAQAASSHAARLSAMRSNSRLLWTLVIIVGLVAVGILSSMVFWMRKVAR